MQQNLPRGNQKSSQGFSLSGCGHGGGRCSGGTSRRSQNDCDNNNKTEKVEFTPHHTGRNQQGATHDTVKKQIMHDIRGQHKFGNDLAESLENNKRHENKDKSWTGMGFTPVTLRDPDEPTKTEETEHTKHVKEKNERFTECLDNMEKAHSLTHGHCNNAMQM